MANKFITKEELNEKLDIYLNQLNSLNLTTEENLKTRISILSKKLNLLSIENFDSDEVIKITEQVSDFMNQYIALLNERIKNKLEGIKQREVTTINEELIKRQELLSAVEEKTHLLWNLLDQVSVSPKLKAILNPIVKSSIQKLLSYHEDVVLVKEQLNIIDKRESLKEKQAYCILKLTEAKASNYSCSDLNQKILSDYNQILINGNAETINFKNLKERKKILIEHIATYASNIELSKGFEGGEVYQKSYEIKMKRAMLGLDEIGEQFFLYFLKKFSEQKIDSYQDLINRTVLVQKLIATRKHQVEELYRKGFAIREEYHTLAENLDHSRILDLAKRLKNIENEYLELEKRKEELEQINILGKEELEEIFNKKERSEVDLSEKQHDLYQKEEMPEIIFTDNYDEFEVLTEDQVEKDKESRKKVLEVNEAKDGLVTQLSGSKWKNKLIKILDALTSVTSFGATLSQSLVSEKKEVLPEEIKEEKKPEIYKKHSNNEIVSLLDAEEDLHETYKDNLVLQGYQWFSGYQKEEHEDIEKEDRNLQDDYKQNIQFDDNVPKPEEDYQRDIQPGPELDDDYDRDYENSGIEFIPCHPIIGNKIKLGSMAKIYSNSVDTISQGSISAGNIGLSEIPLYVTRGVVIDSNKEIVYSTVDYGTDLIDVAKQIGLDYYNIALGCSMGDIEGHFTGVPSDHLNPNIEKGWISASDPNLVVLEMAEAKIRNEGMSR